jgi:hypothetical protein
MKDCFAVLLIIIFSIVNLFSQTPYNADFEEWVMPPSNANEEPFGWKTSNSAGIKNLLTVTKYSDQVYSGKYAAKLQSVSLIGFVSFRGKIGIYNYGFDNTIIPGGAYSYRPDSVYGHYIFYPVDKYEKFVSLIFLTKWRGSYRDTIGYGAFLESERKDAFTRFSFPVEYKSIERPDSILFIISSIGSRWPGTTIIVDNIKFTGGVSKSEFENSPSTLSLYPNPANYHINLSGLVTKAKVEIFDLSGKLLYSDIHEHENVRISLVEFTNGIYYLKTNGFTKLFTVVRA